MKTLRKGGGLDGRDEKGKSALMFLWKWVGCKLNHGGKGRRLVGPGRQALKFVDSGDGRSNT